MLTVPGRLSSFLRGGEEVKRDLGKRGGREILGGKGGMGNFSQDVTCERRVENSKRKDTVCVCTCGGWDGR